MVTLWPVRRSFYYVFVKTVVFQARLHTWPEFIQWTDNAFSCFNGLEGMKELFLLFEMIKTIANVFIQVSKGVP